MQNTKNAINISSASVVDLKAELYKQYEEFKRQRATTGNQSAAASRKKEKKEGIWGRQNKGVAERAKRDERLEAVGAPTLEASRAAMERKARLYDKLKKMGIEDDRLAEEVLVDFDRKAWEQPSSDEEFRSGELSDGDDPWVEHVDEFGRTRVVRKSQLPEESPPLPGSGEDDDVRTDIEQQKWEEEALAELNDGPLHYDESKEIRTKGVGFYRFSKIEEERQEQMQQLRQLRQETEQKRAARQNIKDKRKAQMEARMALIRAKKQKANPTPVDEESSQELSTSAPLVFQPPELASTSAVSTTLQEAQPPPLPPLPNESELELPTRESHDAADETNEDDEVDVQALDDFLSTIKRRVAANFNKPNDH